MRRPKCASVEGPPLSQETQAAPTPAKARVRILSVSYDQGLLLTRAELLLTTPTCQVVSVASLEEASKQVLAKDFDLVILCHTIPEEDARVLIDQVRKRGSAPVLRLGQHTYSLAQAQRSEGAADTASAFLRAVNAILGGLPDKPPSWLLYDKEKHVYRTG